MFYLDTVIAIYIFEGSPEFGASAQSRFEALTRGGSAPATSELTRLECLVAPLKRRDQRVCEAFERFFLGLKFIPSSRPVYLRAAQIRADYNFKLGDALHLAAAVEGGCDRFLTNDAKLARFPDLVVEILPRTTSATEGTP